MVSATGVGRCHSWGKKIVVLCKVAWSLDWTFGSDVLKNIKVRRFPRCHLWWVKCHLHIELELYKSPKVDMKKWRLWSNSLQVNFSFSKEILDVCVSCHSWLLQSVDRLDKFAYASFFVLFLKLFSCNMHTSCKLLLRYVDFTLRCLMTWHVL